MKTWVSGGCLAAGILMQMASVAWGVPGEGIRAGDVLVRPFVSLDVTHSSNPLLLPDGAEQSDVFMDVNPGISLTAAGDYLMVEGLAWGRFRRFDKFDSEDRDDLSQQLRLRLGREDRWRLMLHERYGRVSDYDVDALAPAMAVVTAAQNDAPPLVAVERSERSERDLLDAGIGIGGPLGDSAGLHLRYDYGKVDYRNRNFLDTEEHKTAARATHAITDKSDTLLVAEYIAMDNDSLDDVADYYALRAGWRLQGTAKSSFEASVGYFRFALPTTGGEESDRDGVSYDLSWRWQAMDKLTLLLGGRSEMQLSVDTPESSKLVNSVSTVANYAPTERLTLALTFGFRDEDYTDTDRTAEQYHVRLSGSYALRKWLTLQGSVWNDETRSDSDGDTTEVRATLGLKAMY